MYRYQLSRTVTLKVKKKLCVNKEVSFHTEDIIKVAGLCPIVDRYWL